MKLCVVTVVQEGVAHSFIFEGQNAHHAASSFLKGVRARTCAELPHRRNGEAPKIFFTVEQNTVFMNRLSVV